MTEGGWTGPAMVAVRFNDAINGRDLDALARLMTDDHTFVDSAGGAVTGKAECLDAWRRFFAAYPDYRNVFAAVSAQGEVVTVVGHSVCTHPGLAGPAIWTVTIDDDKVRRWHVHEDTPETRRLLRMPDAEQRS
jgi:ketosteroid isomerase-like protein